MSIGEVAIILLRDSCGIRTQYVDDDDGYMYLYMRYEVVQNYKERER